MTFVTVLNKSPAPDAAFALRVLKSVKDSWNQNWFGENCFLYSSLTEERVQNLTTSHSALCVILQGEKQIWQHGVKESFGAGALIALPKAIEIDVVNTPKSDTEPYVSLSFPLRPTDTRKSAAITGQQTTHSSFSIASSSHLHTAIERLLENLADVAFADDLREMRRQELMLLLQSGPAATLLFDGSISGKIGKLVRNSPDREWTVTLASSELAIAPSTLRRKLRNEGVKFTEVLRDHRLTVAHQMLLDGASSFEAQTLSGFRSRSHFAKHFKDRFGKLPAKV